MQLNDSSPTTDPFIVFITGKYASGKSTLAKRIVKMLGDYCAYIEVDKVIEKYVCAPFPELSRDQAFLVYSMDSDDQYTHAYVNGVKESIAATKKSLIVLDGASPNVLKRLNQEKFHIICLRISPEGVVLHKQRIIKRIRADIANDTYTLPDYWTGDTPLLNREKVKAVIDGNTGDDTSPKHSGTDNGCIDEIIGQLFGKELDAEIEKKIVSSGRQTANIMNTFGLRVTTIVV